MDFDGFHIWDHCPDRVVALTWSNGLASDTKRLEREEDDAYVLVASGIPAWAEYHEDDDATDELSQYRIKFESADAWAYTELVVECS